MVDIGRNYEPVWYNVYREEENEVIPSNVLLNKIM